MGAVVYELKSVTEDFKNLPEVEKIKILIEDAKHHNAVCPGGLSVKLWQEGDSDNYDLQMAIINYDKSSNEALLNAYEEYVKVTRRNGAKDYEIIADLIFCHTFKKLNMTAEEFIKKYFLHSLIG